MAGSDWIGKTLSGRYEIVELLGQGGMSAVYKANDPNLRRVVAIKLIHSHLSSDPEFVRRFEEEAAAVAQLRHPNLIQVYDFTNDGDAYYIVFEFVPGETVQGRLKRLREHDRQMDVAETTDLVAQVADGLHYAHNKGLVHRDIKPANIMINVQGAPIVMDFGIAKIMGGTQHTATGAVLGTARYMSPEQIKGERIDPRTDIYSLGVTLFEMLGGRPPFNADSAMTLMMMHVTDPVPDLRDLRADIPLGLVAVVNKALAKNPDARFQSAAEFAAALRNPGLVTVPAGATILETGDRQLPDPDMTVVEPLATEATAATSGTGTAQTVSSAPTGTTTGPPAPSSAGASSRNWLYIAGGALVLILLVAGIWAAFFRGDDGGGAEPTAVAAVVTDVAPEPTVPPTDTPPEPTSEPTEAPTEAPAEPTEALPEQTAPSGTVGQASGDVTLTVDGEETAVGPDSIISNGAQIATAEDSEVEFALEDGSLIQLGELSALDVLELATDPDDITEESILALVEGNFLLRQPEPGNILTLLDGEDNLLGSLQAAATTSAKPSRALARQMLQETADEAAMAIMLDPQLDEVRISCFAGQCTVGDSFLVPAGEEVVVDRAARALVSQTPITAASESYLFWQEACADCLPKLTEAIVGVPPTQASPTEAPPTQAPPTEAPPAQVPPTATTAAPTATTIAPTATTVPPTATTEPTLEPTPTEPVAEAYAVRITGITLQDGRYVVSYETSGYTEQLPGRHVHFYFDTVSEADAGVPGNGPWILYGGPRPFTQYGEADRPPNATAMCARVAEADHSIIYGSGNCYPLP